MPQMSEFCYKLYHHLLRNNTENAAKLKNATNIKRPQILKCHKFQTIAKVPFYS